MFTRIKKKHNLNELTDALRRGLFSEYKPQIWVYMCARLKIFAKER